MMNAKAKLSHSRRWPSWRPQDEKHDDEDSGRQKQSFLHEWPNGVLLQKRGCHPRDLAGFVQRHRTRIFSYPSHRFDEIHEAPVKIAGALDRNVPI